MAYSPIQLHAMASAAAQKYGVDPNVFIAQITQESGFNPSARSGSGAQGIAQFMPSTAKSYNVNPWDPASALDGAARYDAAELKAFHGDYHQALAAYNAGPGNASRWNDPNFAGGQTYNYVKSILANAHAGKGVALMPRGGIVAASAQLPSANGGQTGGIAAGGSLSRQQLAQLAFATPINFGSNQIQAPNLSALIQARSQQEAQPSPNLPMPVTSQHGAASAPPSGGKGVGIVRTALTQVGQPYQWGGKAVLGGHTDCSGLLQASARANGISIGRTTYQQWQEGTKVDPAHLQVGDAVFFHMGPQGPEHVGIYAGAGKFVEDPHTGSSVRLQSLANYPGFVGARRYG